MGIDNIRNIKESALLPKQKKIYRIPAVSKKKKARQREDCRKKCDEENSKENWFRTVREMLTGVCQCGCGNISQKYNNRYFRFSCCHIFPKKKFKSVMLHPMNHVERAFFGGCHTNMDDRSIELWPQMADWADIKKKFWVLSPLLTEKERATKFYHNLEELVKNN